MIGYGECGMVSWRRYPEVADELEGVIIRRQLPITQIEFDRFGKNMFVSHKNITSDRT
jgi:hypothetical protein